MNSTKSTTQSTRPLLRQSSIRTLVWFTLAVLGVLALATASPAAWAETDVPPGGTVPPKPSPCEKGTLVALPDIAGTTTSSAIQVLPLENDKMVPPEKNKPKEDLPSGPAIMLKSVDTPTHGTATWTQEEVTTVTYTPNADFTGADVFSYTIEDECGRTAVGRIVIVVFRDDMPTQPAIITRPVGPGSGGKHGLNLPGNAKLSIPDAIFVETENSDDPHYFVVTNLGQHKEAVDGAPGLGKRFANVAFRIVEYRNNGEVENPTYQDPLILEIEFDLESGEVPELLYWDEETNSWRSDGIERLSFDPQTGIATFAIHHLTEFAIFAGTADQFLYLPNLTMGASSGN